MKPVRPPIQLTNEDLLRIRKVEKYTEVNKGTQMRCPYCGRWVTTTYPDTKGHIKDICKKCKRPVSFYIDYRYSRQTWYPISNYYNII